MTKQEFVRYFEIVADTLEAQRELGEALHKYLLDGHSVVCFGGKLCDAYTRLLSLASGISVDMIDWLLYEGGGTAYLDKLAKEPFFINTAEDLWEYHQAITTPKRG